MKIEKIAAVALLSKKMMKAEIVAVQKTMLNRGGVVTVRRWSLMEEKKRTLKFYIFSFISTRHVT